MNEPDVHQEIQERLGVLPNFFRLAAERPEISSKLWVFAQFAYLDNPLPSLFKERLFVFLSRFCDARYCVIRHLGFLIGLGKPSGDRHSPTQSVPEVIGLLRRRLPQDAQLTPTLQSLQEISPPLAEWPEAETPLEESLFTASAHVFLQTPDASRALAALAGLLDPPQFQYLMVFLAFIRMAHFWTQVQKDLRLEDDLKELLCTYEGLAEALLDDPAANTCKVSQQLLEELDPVRGERPSRSEMAARLNELQRANEANVKLRMAALNIMEDAVAARHAEERQGMERIRAEKDLRESEERLRAVANIAPGLLWSSDANGDTTWYSQRWLDYTGQTFEQAAGWGWTKAIHPEDREASARRFRQAVKQGRSLQQEHRLRGADGKYRWFLMRAEPLRAENGRVLRMYSAATDIHDLRAAQQQLEKRVRQRTAALSKANESLRLEISQREKTEAERQKLLHRLARAEEDERRRISRELHDEVGQHLAALTMSLKALESGKAQRKAALQDAREIAELLAREIHDLAVELRPTALDDLGLVRALSVYVEEWSRKTRIRADFHSAGLNRKRLPAMVESSLYRITQEALTNVLKHARAKTVSLILERHDHLISLIIEDDGKGFAVNRGQTKKGHKLGILGMKERAALMDGELTIESNRKKGTTIYVRIPLRKRKANREKAARVSSGRSCGSKRRPETNRRERTGPQSDRGGRQWSRDGQSRHRVATRRGRNGHVHAGFERRASNPGLAAKESAAPHPDSDRA